MIDFQNESKAIIFTILILIITIYRLDKGTEILKLINNKMWFFNFMVIMIFSVYIIDIDNEKGEKYIKLQDAVRKGLLAFIIAILARLELTIAPFWIVFVLAFYGNGYV